MLYLYDIGERSWKRWQSLAEECRRRLTGQQIVPGSPGTILKDVRTLLEFVGLGGIVTKSRNATLPAECLPELNAKASCPVALGLKRALLRDYPNLAGPFILLRVMDLFEVRGNRLAVCPTALEFWQGLNPTEQYFALLEALLFQAQSSVLGGERRRGEAQAWKSVTMFLGQLSEHWRNFDRYDSLGTLGPTGELPPWNLFLQQQLGLLELRPGEFSEKERRAWGGHGWLVGGAKLTPWGAAATWALLEFWKEKDREAEEVETDEAASGADERQLEMKGTILLPFSERREAGQTDGPISAESGEDEVELDEAPEDSEPAAEFGILQPAFQPCFPEWQTVYARPQRQSRTGTHIFKVILAGWRGGGGVWRRLAVPADASLDGLAGAILDAFKLDEDHLYDFRYRDRRGKSRVYNHPYTDEGPWTPEIAVGETELALKDEMLFTFDYGDYWQFKVRLESIEAGPSKLRRPRVIESNGKPPPQYPMSD